MNENMIQSEVKEGKIELVKPGSREFKEIGM